MSPYIKKVDHITYACAAGTIEKWAWFHIEVEPRPLLDRAGCARISDVVDLLDVRGHGGIEPT